jgi:hypothetical protein
MPELSEIDTMNKNKIAKIISTVFYPGITGLVFVFILFLTKMGISPRNLVLAGIYGSLITWAPFLIVRLLIKSGKASDQDLSTREERKIFFRTAFPVYVIAFSFLILAGVPKVVFLMGGGVIAFVILYWLVTSICRTSFHVGGLTFDLVALGLVIDKSFYFLLPLVLLVAWSRQRLGKHSISELFLGAIIGGGIPIVLFRFI